MSTEQVRLANALDAYLAHSRSDEHGLSRRAAVAAALAELIDLHPLIDLPAPGSEAPPRSWADVRASVAPAVDAASTTRELAALARVADVLALADRVS